MKRFDVGETSQSPSFLLKLATIGLRKDNGPCYSPKRPNISFPQATTDRQMETRPSSRALTFLLVNQEVATGRSVVAVKRCRLEVVQLQNVPQATEPSPDSQEYLRGQRMYHWGAITS